MVARTTSGSLIRPGGKTHNSKSTIQKTVEEERMTYDVSRRSLLALGAGLGASTVLGGSALARAPKVGTQTPYWHRFNLGSAEVTAN